MNLPHVQAVYATDRGLIMDWYWREERVKEIIKINPINHKFNLRFGYRTDINPPAFCDEIRNQTPHWDYAGVQKKYIKKIQKS